MTELMCLSGEEVVRRLEKLGFQRAQQRGSHLKKGIAKRVNSIHKTIRHRLISQSMDIFYKGVYQDFSLTPSIFALKDENPDVSYPAVEALKKIRGKDFGEAVRGRREIKEVFKMNITKTKEEANGKNGDRVTPLFWNCWYSFPSLPDPHNHLLG